MLLFFALGMNRGLLLSSDILSSRWPWQAEAASSQRPIQAPALSDPVWQFVPWLRLARRQIAGGSLPLWNPHQDGGVPLLGNAQSALASPLNWPVLVLDADPGWNLSLLARLLLAAAASFAFLRDLGRTRLAASLGAVAFSLSGSFVAWLEHPQALAAAPAPLVFLFARRAACDASAGAIAGLALSTFLVLAGGHPETALMVAILAAGVIWSSGRGVRRWLRPLAGAALGAGLAAPVLLPFAEYFALSAAKLGEGRRPFVLAARDLWRLVTPRLAGSNGIEAAAGVSLVVLALLPAGVAAARRDAPTRFWGLAAAGMMLAIYDNPLARALAAATPVYWTRGLLFLPLAMGVVSSAGLDAIRRRLAARSRPPALIAALLAVALSLTELLRAAQGVHAVTPGSRVAPSTPLLAKLAADGGVFRVLPLHTFLSPNAATQYGLDDVRGYDALGPAAWRSARAAMGRFADVPTQKDAIEPWDLAPGGAALDYWNVKYLLQPPRFAFGAETLNAKRGLDLEEVYSGPDGRILENRRVKPRARMGVPGRVVLLERRPALWRIEVRAEAPGRLELADPYFPGWRARVDGAASALAARPGEAMAVPVPAGRHVVELSYEPASFRLGTGVGIVSGIGLIALVRRKRLSRPALAVP